MQLLQDVLRIMNDAPDAKDVFQQLDGFLAVMNMLSNLRWSRRDSVPTPSSEHRQRVSDTLGLAFRVLCEAMKHHPQNRSEFEVCLHAIFIIERD